MYKLDLEKAEEQEIKLPTSLDHQKSKRIPLLCSIPYLYFWFINYAKAFDCVDYIQTMEIFLKRWEYQTTLPASWEICMQVQQQQLEMDMGQQTGSKLGERVY